MNTEVFRSSGVDLLQEMNREAGWQVEYRQLEPGALQTASSLRELAGLSLLDERSDRRLELAAQPPDGMVSVVVPGAPDTMSFNGTRMETGALGVFSPGAELIAVTHGAADATSLQIPAELFARDQRDLAPDGTLPPRGCAVVAQETGPAVGRLQAILEKARRVGGSPLQEVELAAGLVAAVVEGLASHPSAGSRASAPKAEVLRISREYIEANLHRPIRMASVCKAAGTSLSSLERFFRTELGTTPLAYVRVRRLNAVRRVLTGSELRDRPIARIATEYGFGHLGRFSQAYRDHFGELPSETRRNRI